MVYGTHEMVDASQLGKGRDAVISKPQTPCPHVVTGRFTEKVSITDRWKGLH